MHKFNLVSLDKVWEEIDAAYDTSFIKELMAISGVDVYCFGGMITDLSLGKKWKDIDLRVVLDKEQEIRDKEILNVLEKYSKILINFKNVYNSKLK